MKIINLTKLIVAIIFCELAGVIGSIFTIPSIPTWYISLIKPTLAPPNWVFGPVWIILFALMGIALFLIWKNGVKSKDNKIALSLFVSQLFLNILWSIIFFDLHSPVGAFLEIIFLWLTIFTTIIAFKKISRAAAWLLVPYLVWVSFAAYLNFTIWMLN